MAKVLCLLSITCALLAASSLDARSLPNRDFTPHFDVLAEEEFTAAPTVGATEPPSERKYYRGRYERPTTTPAPTLDLKTKDLHIKYIPDFDDDTYYPLDPVDYDPSILYQATPESQVSLTPQAALTKTCMDVASKLSANVRETCSRIQTSWSPRETEWYIHGHEKYVPEPTTPEYGYGSKRYKRSEYESEEYNHPTEEESYGQDYYDSKNEYKKPTRARRIYPTHPAPTTAEPDDDYEINYYATYKDDTWVEDKSLYPGAFHERKHLSNDQRLAWVTKLKQWKCTESGYQKVVKYTLTCLADAWVRSKYILRYAPWAHYQPHLWARIWLRDLGAALRCDDRVCMRNYLNHYTLDYTQPDNGQETIFTSDILDGNLNDARFPIQINTGTGLYTFCLLQGADGVLAGPTRDDLAPTITTVVDSTNPAIKLDVDAEFIFKYHAAKLLKDRVNLPLHEFPITPYVHDTRKEYETIVRGYATSCPDQPYFIGGSKMFHDYFYPSETQQTKPFTDAIFEINAQIDAIKAADGGKDKVWDKLDKLEANYWGWWLRDDVQIGRWLSELRV